MESDETMNKNAPGKKAVLKKVQDKKDTNNDNTLPQRPKVPDFEEEKEKMTIINNINDSSIIIQKDYNRDFE